MTTRYVPKADYQKLLQELLEGTGDGLDRENSIKITLGERADVWPVTIETTKKEENEE